MRQPSLLLVFPLLFALMLALAACGGDDAPSDEEYFREMDEVDKEVDTRFESVCASEDITAKQCATEYGDGLTSTETQYDDVNPSEDAKDEHEELVAAIKESRENIENAADDFSDDDPADAFFESDAFDFAAVFEAFCAIQDLADEKGIEADVGCDGGEEEAVDPSTLPAEETTEVFIQDFVFDPPHIQVAVGDTVTWTEGADPEPHTATADDETFDSGVLEEGDTFEFTFEEAGEFSYFCEIHPEMLGLVTVTE
jgi:plastocyanin